MDLIQRGEHRPDEGGREVEYERGNKFSTYAYWWIKQATSARLRTSADHPHPGPRLNEKIKKIARVARELGETLGRKPTRRRSRRSCACPS